MNRFRASMIVVLASLLVYAAGAAWAGDDIKTSGFLAGVPQFEPDKDRPDARIYRSPGTDLSKYGKVLIDPIEIWVAPDSEYKGLDTDEIKTIADTLRQVLVKELEPDYPVVNEPGAGVLGVRMAITNVHVQKKKRGLLGYTPIGLVVTTAGNLAGMRVELKDATIEAELLDGGTNERLGALIDRLGGQGKEDKTSWEDVEKTLGFYAKRFRSRLDAERGAN